MKITGNTILVTGGTSGIGLGLALRLREAGNTVVVAGRRRELLERIADEHPGVGTVELDVTDPESIARARRQLVAAYPNLNVVVTAAGIMVTENLRDPHSLRVAEDTVATNLLGTIRTVYAFVPHLLTQDDAAILTVSSGLAFVPLPITPTYNATKAAVHSFSEGLRVQLAGTGIQVIELVPPAVRTTLMNQQDLESAMPLEEFLAETMALLRAQPDAREILVENVKFLRNAATDGTYDNVLALLSSH
ncbi:SDR family oxidoreductase [Nocardia alni]|uniref:SDR family oxidoreductase n=1 Tax=Nocardia alni TaxID=2815723 RepID=UPI001C21B9C5|nr:SDR family NAD(P)-dependent oxidoreductase [Nocardia alni]